MVSAQALTTLVLLTGCLMAAIWVLNAPGKLVCKVFKVLWCGQELVVTECSLGVEGTIAWVIYTQLSVHSSCCDTIAMCHGLCCSKSCEVRRRLTSANKCKRLLHTIIPWRTEATREGAVRIDACQIIHASDTKHSKQLHLHKFLANQVAKTSDV